jgi:hypothetical protein
MVEHCPTKMPRLTSMGDRNNCRLAENGLSVDLVADLAWEPKEVRIDAVLVGLNTCYRFETSTLPIHDLQSLWASCWPSWAFASREAC